MPLATGRPHRQIFDIEGHAFFVTFSCYRRLSLLGRNRCKRIVLGQLDLLSWRHQVGVAGYCVMPNHVHILLRPVRAGLLGTFLQALEKLEYMHNNPVKAGLVKDACEWQWSSAAYLLKGKPSPVRMVPVDGPIVWERVSSQWNRSGKG